VFIIANWPAHDGTAHQQRAEVARVWGPGAVGADPVAARLSSGRLDRTGVKISSGARCSVRHTQS